jgi:hypothetical protein
MRTKEELDRLRERSIALGREGKSNREIKAILGPMSTSTLTGFLRGVPPPDWTRRPNAKDELRTTARSLRNLGLDYDEIVASLGVSKSSVSLWVRDLPTPQGLSSQEIRERAAEGSRQYWARQRKVRAAHRANERNAAAASNATTPRPHGKTSATAITGASGLRFAAAQGCTVGSKAGLLPSWRLSS